MTEKEMLNSILRLRLFYSTEKELSELVGYNLKGNHFSRFKAFQCEAYLSKFAEMCRSYSGGGIDLVEMLRQYEATSSFFKRHIENTAHQRNKRFVPNLLSYIFLGSMADEGVHDTKDVVVCERYEAQNKDGCLNIGILLLITYGVLPTFNNKSVQDIADITSDFQRAYDLLLDIAHSRKHNATTKFGEMLCLKEMRNLIEEERSGDKYLNRLLLIHIANDVLTRIFAMENPSRMKAITTATGSMDFNLERLWRCDEEADNVVWRFEPLTIDAYYLYRHEIDYHTRQVRYTRYQLMFKDVGYKDFCYTVIMRPEFNYNNLLGREQGANALSYDYTDIEYADDGSTVRQMTFTRQSPTGGKPMRLKPLNDDNRKRYYNNYLRHKGAASDFTDVDQQAEYDVRYAIVEVAMTQDAVLFNMEGSVYRLDKYDSEGCETIDGVSALSHNDNFVIAELQADGVTRRFLCLDSINQNLDLERLLHKPFFRRITSVGDVF